MPARVSTGDRDAVKFLGAELIKVSKTRHLTFKIVSADFAAVRKLSAQKFNGTRDAVLPTDMVVRGRSNTGELLSVCLSLGHQHESCRNG